MTNSKIDLEYFERGLALVLGQLEYLIEKISNIDYKYVEDLTFKQQAFDAAKDDDEFQKIAAAYSDIRQNIVDDPIFANDREIFFLTTEIDRLNNHLLTLLTEKNGSHSIEKVQKYLMEEFEVKVREILAYNEKVNLLDPQALEILKILVNEKKFSDIEEGINLVLSLTELNAQSKTICEAIAEAHILVVYDQMLKDDDKPAKTTSKAKPKPKKKKKK